MTIPEEITRQAGEARRTLRALAGAADVVVLAVATNGLHGEVIQACVWAGDAVGGELVFNDYARPRAAFDGAAAAFHGLSASALREAPPTAVMLDGLRAALAGRVVLVFNAGYAARALCAAADACGAAPLESAGWVDAQGLASRAYGTFSAAHGNVTLLSVAAAVRAAGLMEGPEGFTYPPKSAIGVAERTWAFVHAHAEDLRASPEHWPAFVVHTAHGPVRLDTARDWM